MQILSFILSALGTASLIISFIVKGKKMGLILFLVAMANLLVAVSYLIDGSINGACSCALGAVIAVINYFFSKAEKRVPTFLLAIYILAFAVLNFAAGGFCINSLLVVAATSAFVLGIAAQNGKAYRACALFNVILWCAYDILTRSHAALASHAIQLVMLLFGIFINDRKKENK